MKRKKNFTGLILLLMVPLMTIFVMQPEKVHADDKEYRVDSAEFDVEYESDGAAVITEKWDVTYLKGEFTRFYKDINNPANNLEHFDGVQVIGCSVDGVEAEASSSVDRVDYHYYYEVNSTSETDTIHWFLHSSDQTVHYEIKYRIENSVKLDEDDDAVFCYRFIGANFPKTVGNTIIKAEIPGNTEDVSVTCSDGDYYFDGNILVSEAENVSGILKLRVEMDSSAFSGLSRVADGNYSSNSDSDDDFPFLMILVIIGFILFWPALIIWFIVWCINNSREYKKLKRENPDFIAASAGKIEKYNLPLMWIAFLFSGSSISLFNTLVPPMAIMDMCSRKVLKFSREGLRYNRSDCDEDPVISEFDNRFFEILKRNFFKEDGFSDSNEMFIPMDRLNSFMDDEAKRSALCKDTNKWQKEYFKAYVRSPKYTQLVSEGAIKQIKKELSIIKKHANQEMTDTDAARCMSVVERNGCLSVYTFLNLIVNYKSRATEKNPVPYERDSICYFCYQLDSDMASRQKSTGSSDSGSGCSSCSSCSSCSGCGGGGAD